MPILEDCKQGQGDPFPEQLWGVHPERGPRGGGQSYPPPSHGKERNCSQHTLGTGGFQEQVFIKSHSDTLKQEVLIKSHSNTLKQQVLIKFHSDYLKSQALCH